MISPKNTSLHYFRSGKVKLPEWVDIVKTNVAKELAPFDEDWYYTRLASLARHIYIRSPVGVSTVCKIYGYSQPLVSWFGIIARKALQPLNNSKWSKKIPMEVNKVFLLFLHDYFSKISWNQKLIFVFNFFRPKVVLTRPPRYGPYCCPNGCFN